MKPFIACERPSHSLTLSVALCFTVLASNSLSAANNPPSFEPGDEPTSSACDGLVRFAGWMKNVTDNDGDVSRLQFEITAVTNPDLFSVHPWVSWPSLSLNYQIKPGTPGGLVSEVTAILSDDGGIEGGGNDTSQPQTWKIYTGNCVAESPDQGVADTDRDGVSDEVDEDDDNDGISDVDEGSGVIDTDGDGTADSQDLDSDDDLIPDADEPDDTDGDGIRDSEEPDGYDVETDSDGDGVHDGRDLDDDNDGIIDSLEGAGTVDTDGDGVVDSLDLDSDNDGRSDLLESGLNLIVLTFDASWSLEDDVGDNGLVDLLETFRDSGYPVNYPVDFDGDGIADFQDATDQLFNDEDQSIAPADANRFVSTGLSGSGCTVGSSGFDPVMLLSLVAAFAGMRRRWRRTHAHG